jgi:hypothetical protein
MSAKHMWTVEQWREIVDCARRAVACRQKARIDRSMFRASKSRWLMSDARHAERSARGYERRVVCLLRMWAPEERAAMLAKSTGGAA